VHFDRDLLGSVAYKHRKQFTADLKEIWAATTLPTALETATRVADAWHEYNHLRPHSSLGGRPPAPETIAFPGFSLADFAPPAAREPVLALS